MSFRGKKSNRRGEKRSDFYPNKRTKFEKREYRHQEQLMEEDVGISQFISKLSGYPAVIKARFSDFQVNEINLEGKLAKLTDTSIPKNFACAIQKHSYEDTTESPSDKIPQATWEAVREMVAGSGIKPVELEADKLTKDDRKCIHECVKRYFGSKVVASTITKNEKTILEFKKWNKANNADERMQWPANTPEYVHFILHKQMMDTMLACYKISQALKMASAKITYAGVKDKRSKSTQWCCIRKYDPSKLISKTKFIKNIKMGNFEFKDTCLKLGQLKGNRFRIALRNVIADDDLITSTLAHAKEHGFINYYGLQRFGNDKEAPTYLVGIKLLQGEWKEAVDLILKVKSADDPMVAVNIAKKVYAETGDAAKALKICNRNQNFLEKKLLEGLSKTHKNDYVTALENVPRNMRLLYIHAYQSFIWNKMVSKRIEQFGLKPVEGDLIFVDNLQDENLLLDDIADDDEIENTSAETVDEIADAPSDEEDKKTPDKPAVRPLAADELDQYTIFDIVLPLPGYDVIYPVNLVQYYKEAIEECGLTLEMPKQKVKTYTLSGKYRKLVERATDFEWKIMHYNEPTDNLIRSDLEELNGEGEPESVENGKYKAVVVEFSLNPASYATMVLREILKCNTSSSAQAGMNDYGEKKSNVIIESSNGINDVKEESSLSEVQEGSLLADRAKYEDFQNNLFKDLESAPVTENSHKREIESDKDEVVLKKPKTDEQKME